MKSSYRPSDDILAKYADLIVKFGLQRPDGSALPKGSVVQFNVPEIAKPFYFHLQKAILKNGHHPLGNFIPSSDPDYQIKKSFYEHANKHQLEFVPFTYHKALVDVIDATILIVAETDIHELTTITGKKVMQHHGALKEVKDLKFKKIDAGKLSWTIAMYGTDHMANEASISPKTYWQQIIEACYLDEPNPVATWRKLTKTNQKTATKLDNLDIQQLHWKGADMDITVGIGSDRKWQTGGGNNIPSYEVFTSPNRHEADGWIRFNQPHFRYGKKIEGIELHFKNGKVTKATATNHQDMLRNMVKTAGGNMLGEVSLTDARMSRITKPTGEILYDENMGGKYGNTHMAIGSSFHDCYKGNGSKFTKQKWENLGFNDSVVHSDFVSTTNRTVTATLPDGSQKVIYQNGQFTI